MGARCRNKECRAGSLIHYLILINRSCPRPSNSLLIQAEQCDGGANGCQRRRSQTHIIYPRASRAGRGCGPSAARCVRRSHPYRGRRQGQQSASGTRQRQREDRNKPGTPPPRSWIFFATVSAHTRTAACGAMLVNRMRIMAQDVATGYLFVATPALHVMLAANARGVHSTPLLAAAVASWA
jgi:hypothetical protein